MNKRKLIQIERREHGSSILGLCDDGSLWEGTFHLKNGAYFYEWTRLTTPPEVE